MGNIKRLVEVECSSINTNGEWLFSKTLLKGRLNNFSYPCKDLIPVLIQECDNGYDLIWGYEILHPILNTPTQVKGLCIQANDLEKGLINLCLLPNIFQGKEKFIVCARYFQGILPKDRQRDFFYKVFREYLLNKEIALLLNWINLPQCFDPLALSGNISLDMTSYILRFNAMEQVLFVPFFNKVRWGKNKARIFLDLVFELSRGKGLSVKDILRPLTEILDKDLSPNDKIQSILEHLRDMRYPSIRRIRQEFDNRVSNIFTKHKGIKIIPSKGFETDELILQIRIDRSCSIKELAQILLDSSPGFEEFYSWYTSTLNAQDS